MSARTPGAPSMAAQAATRTNATRGATDATKKYMWQLPLGQPGASNEFPIVPVTRDPYDDTANIKGQFATDMGKDSKWVVPFSEGDAQYVLRKRDAEEKAEFDAWIMQKFNITDPSQNLMLQSIAPELFQRREEVIDVNQDLVSRYAKLRLRGPKSEDDLRFEWLLETGRMELPKGPIWDPSEWRKHQFGPNPGGGLSDADWDKQNNRARYVYGLFSPISWITQATSGWQRNNANLADIRGDPAHKLGLDPTQPIKYPDPANANWWAGYPTVYPNAGGNLGLTRANTPAEKRVFYAQTVGRGLHEGAV